MLLAIKQVLDQNPRATGQFLLTGSANLLAARHVADALPGRVEYVNLWPLSQGEIEGRREVFIDHLLDGRVPTVVDADNGRAAQAARIVTGGFRIDSAKLQQLLRLLAARTSGTVNYSSLGSELGVDEKTVKAHIELLEQLFLVLRLPPWSRNLAPGRSRRRRSSSPTPAWPRD